MSIKLERLGNIFVKEISEIIRDEVRDEDIKYNMVTITYVNISSDLSYAKIYFTTLDFEDKDMVLKGLNRASRFIRGQLADRVEIRKIPELTFIYDESIDYASKIEGIIKEINE